MRDLSMNEATFKEVVGPYKKRLWLADASDLEDVFNLVHDLLVAEANALRENEQYAFTTIREHESAATHVDNFRFDVAYAWEEVYGE